MGTTAKLQNFYIEPVRTVRVAAGTNASKQRMLVACLRELDCES